MTSKTSKPEEVVREAWLYLTLVMTSGDCTMKKRVAAQAVVEAAIRASERARLAAQVGPLTPALAHPGVEQSCRSSGFLNQEEGWAEIDALRAQVSAVREQLAEVTRQRDRAWESERTLRDDCAGFLED